MYTHTPTCTTVGADFIVCDEGHVLRHEDSHLSKVINQVRTKRRIVLSGTPLQNSLKECECIESARSVQFYLFIIFFYQELSYQDGVFLSTVIGHTL